MFAATVVTKEVVGGGHYTGVLPRIEISITICHGHISYGESTVVCMCVRAFRDDTCPAGVSQFRGQKSVGEGGGFDGGQKYR